MAQISAIARNFIQSRLLDDGTGFNFWMVQRAARLWRQPVLNYSRVLQ